MTFLSLILKFYRQKKYGINYAEDKFYIDQECETFTAVASKALGLTYDNGLLNQTLTLLFVVVLPSHEYPRFCSGFSLVLQRWKKIFLTETKVAHNIIHLDRKCHIFENLSVNKVRDQCYEG